MSEKETTDKRAEEVLHGPVVTEGTGEGVVSDVVHSMFNPGTPSSVIKIMNVVFIALAFLLALLLATREFNIHLAIMLAMTLVLVVLVNYLLVQLSHLHSQHNPTHSPDSDGKKTQ